MKFGVRGSYWSLLGKYYAEFYRSIVVSPLDEVHIANKMNFMALKQNFSSVWKNEIS
jgi:hypothetical protein